MKPGIGSKTMTTPIVSVVMSVFNGERFLAEAVESILYQDFLDFEFIIIDDGSTDDSASILDSYQDCDARIRVYHEEHSGLVKSLNRGCELARGKYIARMDADDVASKVRLALQVSFMEAHPEIGVVGGSVEWINAVGESLYISTNPTEDGEIKADLLFRRRCAFWHPTVVLRREVFSRAGGYRCTMIGAEDYDFWLRAAENFQLANLETVLVKYRIHSSQVSIQRRIHQTRATLAAQLAAKRRMDGFPDLLDGVKVITSEALVAWGISIAEQRSEVFSDYRKWIRIMCNAGEYDSALEAAREVLEEGVEDVERWQAADLHLTIAQLLWRKRQFLGSATSAVHAFLLRPLVAGRPVKRLLMVRPKKIFC
jgi:glycosyltransferase involved in cell wall biosynthesis